VRDLLILAVHLLVTFAKLCGRGDLERKLDEFRHDCEFATHTLRVPKPAYKPVFSGKTGLLTAENTPIFGERILKAWETYRGPTRSISPHIPIQIVKFIP